MLGSLNLRSMHSTFEEGTVFRLGSGEMLVVLVVAMLFLGPQQIKVLIKRWQENLKVLRQTTEQLSEEINEKEV